jgi:predicted DNA-binding protein with PD1-like motif
MVVGGTAAVTAQPSARQCSLVLGVHAARAFTDAESGTMQALRIRNSELLAAIEQQAKAAGIASGAIVSLIGAVDSFTVSTMLADDASKDVLTDYALPAEMTGTSEIVDGKPHVHVVMAIQGDRALAGHLHRAEVGTWFANVYVEPRVDRPN